MFCLVYKLGARFSKRPLTDVKRDVDRAAALNEVLQMRGCAESISGENRDADRIIREIESAKAKTGQEEEHVASSLSHKVGREPDEPQTNSEGEDDERFASFASWLGQERFSSS